MQSPASPLGLDIAAPVYLAASDEQAAGFQTNALPGLMDFINANLSEVSALADVSSVALDPAKLKLATQANVRVYFLGEGAGYHNTLGFNNTGIGAFEGSPSLIFPDASSRVSWYNSTASVAQRTSREPLAAGDFVDLGRMDAGQTLDFFLIANGANYAAANQVWTGYESYNSDGLQHMASFAVAGSPYLLLSFEDIRGGGDRDYNDLVFAVDIGAANVKALANPEPPILLTFALLAGVAFWVRARQQRGAAGTALG